MAQYVNDKNKNNKKVKGVWKGKDKNKKGKRKYTRPVRPVCFEGLV